MPLLVKVSMTLTIVYTRYSSSRKVY